MMICLYDLNLPIKRSFLRKTISLPLTLCVRQPELKIYIIRIMINGNEQQQQQKRKTHHRIIIKLNDRNT